MIFDRFLSSSTVYPVDYGYLMGHRGRDGDPLDAMVCVSEPTFPGCVIPVKPIALFKMRDDKGEDDKIVCVPNHDPGWNHAEILEDIPEQLQREIHSLLLDLQAARGQVGRGRGVAIARGGARGDRRRAAPAGRVRGRWRRPTGRTWLDCRGSRGRLPRAQIEQTRRIPPVQDRGLAAYIAELVGTLFPGLHRHQRRRPSTSRSVTQAAQFGSRLRGRRARPRLRALRPHPRPRRSQRRALQPGRDDRGGGAEARSTRSTPSSTSSPSSRAACSAPC